MKARLAPYTHVTSFSDFKSDYISSMNRVIRPKGFWMKLVKKKIAKPVNGKISEISAWLVVSALSTVSVSRQEKQF